MRIGKSRIHAQGVFAAAHIPRGRKVIEYTGERIGMREAGRRLQKIFGPRGSKIVDIFQLTRRTCIDGAVGGSGAEIINHSCQPNLVTRKLRGHILYFSRRSIRKGEELCVDYRFPRRGMRVPCRCGTPRCRGTINLSQ
jgi:SET domain-containing protein